LKLRKGQVAEITNSEKRLEGDVSVENISFKYSGSESNTLESISLKIPYRSTIGIIGSSGSGKSTLLDILVGALSVHSGSVKVGGIKLNKSNIRAWRNSLGYVSQMSLIKDGSIGENIAFGLDNTEINFEKLQSASDMAQLTEWVQTLPDKFDTRVGEKGVQISGGQRQRIAIARALYNDAEYLFFDEATSALDGITEKQIMESISSMSGLKTIIMIAHRLNTIKNCDQIYILSEGKIVASGNYNELSNQNEYFQKMLGVGIND
jgi:ABC-type bacteriocin/lantibiotic exporter with double-glycine peptidase domain